MNKGNKNVRRLGRATTRKASRRGVGIRTADRVPVSGNCDGGIVLGCVEYRPSLTFERLLRELWATQEQETRHES